MFVRLLAPVFYTCGGSGLFAIRFRGHVFFVAFSLSFIFKFRRLSLTGFIIVPIGGLLAFAFGLNVPIVTIGWCAAFTFSLSVVIVTIGWCAAFTYNLSVPIVTIEWCAAFTFGLSVAIATILIYFPLLVFRSIFKYLIFGGMIE